MSLDSFLFGQLILKSDLYVFHRVLANYAIGIHKPDPNFHFHRPIHPKCAHRLQTAVQAMRLLVDYQPRLVGAVATGATTEEHRVQLHCFADKPEQIDWLLESRGIPFDVSDRRHRYPDGQSGDVPVLDFMAAEIGVSVSVFPERELRRAPLSPVDGLPMKRLELAAVESLAGEIPEVLAG